MKKIIINCLIILSFLISGFVQLISQEPNSFSLHPKLGVIYNNYSTDFNNYYGIINCGNYSGGDGFGYTVNLFGEYNLLNDIGIGIGFSFIYRSGALSRTNFFPTYDNQSLKIVNVQTETRIETGLSFFEINPILKYKVMDKLISGPLNLIGGLRIGIPINKSFEQKEIIISPENVVFTINELRTKERSVSSGNFETLNNPSLGLNAGIENQLKAGVNTYFTQSLIFDYNFTSLLTDADWTVMGVRFELGLKFDFEKTKSEIPTVIIHDNTIVSITDQIEEDKKDTSIQIIKDKIVKPKPYIDLSFTDRDLVLLTGSELLAWAPVVTSVFFDRNSDKIPDEYDTSSKYDASAFGENPVDVHKFVLPRIVSILNKNKGSSLTLEGATSGPEYEMDGKKLALKRSLNVKNAFVNLGVDSNLIVIKSRIFPRIISNQDHDKGVIENQRVDIIVNNAPIQEYVNVRKYAEMVGTITAKLDFRNIPDSVNKQFFNSFESGKKDILEPGEETINVNMRVDLERDNVDYYANLKCGGLDQTASSNVIPSRLPEKQVELNLDRFEAILMFDYDKSYLKDDIKGLLIQLAEVLPDNVIITIYGSADALGTIERNIVLEKERAEITKKFIKSVTNKNFEFETLPGIDKYPEDSSQGRFVNRSIRIRARYKK